MKFLRKGDLILTVALLLAALTAFLLIRNIQPNKVTLTYEGGEARIDLSRDGIYDFVSNGINVHIQVQDGKAAFVRSECPDHLCESCGICLPARAALTSD